ncbi:MAG: GMC family oxidoreductase N-terminal domain-containing protein [Thermomicrobiales bacterium]|nr:GMC family oxidoreductase N-terminal domain-containing protein [Thermomicrobiales bacterium]
MAQRTFDYIIVGAGSSGCALAGRLSEDPATSVLLLEAGPDFRADAAPPEMHSANPLGMNDPKRFPDYCWPDLLAQRTPQQAPRRYDRGRGVGGSSSINYQVAFRGVPDDYDRWAVQGATGWAWADVLPYFRTLEDDRDFGDAPHHGRGGPVPIERLRVAQWGKVDLALLEAALDSGYPWSPDHNAPGAGGIGPYAANRRGGRRVSAADAYLEPARGRPNLAVLGQAHVDRVLFAGRQAVGVRVLLDGEWREVRGREILLAAGSVATPGLLVRSGIGPAAALAELGVPLLVDLPVGEMLADHAMVGFDLHLKPLARAQSRDDRFISGVLRYSSGLAGAGDNDMLIVGQNHNGYDDDALRRGWLAVIAWQTFSRGRLRVTSADPFAMPRIDEQMLTDTRDLVRLRDGVRRLIALARHQAFTDATDAIALHGWPGVAASPALTDQEIDDWMRATVADTWHIVGTCRMGAPDDPQSVVDPHCRVRGVAGLRVIDASIMPEVPRANTHLSCLMIAEKMADELRTTGKRGVDGFTVEAGSP